MRKRPTTPPQLGSIAAPARAAALACAIAAAILGIGLTGEGESSLSERGKGRGTFSGTVTAHLKLNPGKVDGVYTISPKGGSVTGRASARFVIRGSTGYYGGTLTITRGTGIYRRASGSNIGISGTINRQTFALTVKAHGWIRY
jgi:hypothetical protein